MSVRYEGKPFLKMVDSYVLDAIGELDADSAAELDASGDWRATVAGEMQFPDGMAGAIREVWDKGRAKFRAAQGYDPDPREFARTFVDTNFPH